MKPGHSEWLRSRTDCQLATWARGYWDANMLDEFVEIVREEIRRGLITADSERAHYAERLANRHQVNSHEPPHCGNGDGK